tara:strand:- start:695 stop:946 length:252 start_codon:yes stop_codon:yes gene_type:complete
MIRLLYLINNQILIAKIEEVGADIGEPDCKLIEPFLVDPSSLDLSPWLLDYTVQNTMMMSSDKILTIVEPNTTLTKKYEDLIK